MGQLVVSGDPIDGGKSRRTVEDDIGDVVRDHGWFAADISDHDPPFLYSIGLMQSYGHPEFIIFGLESRQSHSILSAMIESIRDGRSFAEAGTYDGVLAGNRRIGARPVHATRHPLYLGFAMGYCRHTGAGDLHAMQVFWPDAEGKFPFDVGCDLDTFQRQPRLDIALTPKEIKEFTRQFE